MGLRPSGAPLPASTSRRKGALPPSSRAGKLRIPETPSVGTRSPEMTLQWGLGCITKPLWASVSSSVEWG